MDANHELIIHVASYHTDRSANYNERNLGLGIRIKESERMSWAAGFYRNSLNENTVYAGAVFDLLYAGSVAFRVAAVGATGYALPVAPALVPELSLSWHGYGLNVNYMPRIHFGDAEVSEVWAVSLSRKF